MAYPKHLLLTFGGPLGTEGETWSCGIRLCSTGTAGASDGALVDTARAFLADVRGDVETYMTAMNGTLNKDTRLGWVKFNAIGTDGKYIGDNTIEHHYATPLSYTSGSGGPYQLSLAVSFTTAVKRGLAHRGRIFLPVGNLLHVGGHVGGTTPQNVAAGTATFLRNLGNWPGLDNPFGPVPCVVSRGKRVGNDFTGSGEFRPITGISVGTMMDTQQRRRRNQREQYVSVAL